MADQAPREDRSLAPELSAFRRARRRGLASGIALAFVVVLFALAYGEHERRIHSFLRGEIDWSGAPQYVPEHPPHPEAVDFERVHEELLPRWSLALSHATTPHGRYGADRSWQELDEALAGDRNLRELFAETHVSLRDDPLGHARRIDYLLWAYNRYLDEQRVPWRLEAVLALRGERPVLYAMTYEVLADAHSVEGHRLRLVRRADPTSTVEGWLGKTGRDGEGAFVLMQRVLHFTVRHVWPAMHSAIDERRPAQERSWLPFVRAEVEAELDPRTIALLRETAVDQQALIEVSEAIDAREICGSQFKLRGLPYNGLTPQIMRAIYIALDFAGDHADCPEITLDEAARIVGASERLGTTPGLEDALERLAMVVARSVAAHELRHVADPEDLPCPGCSERVVGVAREEVSGYLAALGTPGAGYLALLQACTTADSPNVQSAARRAVLETLLPYGCSGPPHPRIYEHAAALEEELFGERARVEVPSLPSRVTLLPRREPPPRVARGEPLPTGWGMRLGGRTPAATP